jgi:uridine kinase
MKNNLIIGIGGISSSGKSTLADRLAQTLKADRILRIDEYGTGPIMVYDKTADMVIENHEDISTYNLSLFYSDLAEAKKTYRLTIAEGFLLYDRQDITDLIDIKITLNVDKAVCKERIKGRPHRNAEDYYFDNYVWKLYMEKK